MVAASRRTTCQRTEIDDARDAEKGHRRQRSTKAKRSGNCDRAEPAWRRAEAERDSNQRHAQRREPRRIESGEGLHCRRGQQRCGKQRRKFTKQMKYIFIGALPKPALDESSCEERGGEPGEGDLRPEDEPGCGGSRNGSGRWTARATAAKIRRCMTASREQTCQCDAYKQKWRRLEERTCRYCQRGANRIRRGQRCKHQRRGAIENGAHLRQSRSDAAMARQTRGESLPRHVRKAKRAARHHRSLSA